MQNIKKYRVMGDTKNTFLNIELNLVLEDDSIGAHCKVLGGDFIISQNGKILVLTNSDWVVTLMDITEPVKVQKPKLIINETLDTFFDTKEIEIRVKSTYKELFEVLKKEWNFVSDLRPEPFPFEYNEDLKLFTFLNDWNFSECSLKNMINGSFSRKNTLGRNI